VTCERLLRLADIVKRQRYRDCDISAIVRVSRGFGSELTFENFVAATHERLLRLADIVKRQRYRDCNISAIVRVSRGFGKELASENLPPRTARGSSACRYCQTSALS